MIIVILADETIFNLMNYDISDYHFGVPVWRYSAIGPA
jgi:hypothetical protein